MAALAIDRAPEASLPLHFLRMSPIWGLMAAALLLQQGELLFASRWASATIAFVHAFTLGVVGNAMLGSLLQFLPVVADTQPHLGRFGRGLAIAYNLGLLTLIAGLLRWPMLLAPSGLVLATVLTIFALGTLAGIRFDGKQSLLRAGLALSLLMLLTTAILGMVLTLALAGWIAVPLPMLSDIHAATGVLGGGVLLAASVGSVVLPMFQGTPRVGTAARRIRCRNARSAGPRHEKAQSNPGKILAARFGSFTARRDPCSGSAITFKSKFERDYRRARRRHRLARIGARNGLGNQRVPGLAAVTRCASARSARAQCRCIAARANKIEAAVAAPNRCGRARARRSMVTRDKRATCRSTACVGLRRHHV